MSYYVYIMASFRRVLYIGVTSNIEKRVWQHKNNVFKDGFTARYRVHRLVYFETYSDILTAIAREKALKHFTRAEKIALIESDNPKWNDLAEDWGKILPPRFARRKDDIQSAARHKDDTQRGARRKDENAQNGRENDIQRGRAWVTLGLGHTVSEREGCRVLQLTSSEGTNRLTSAVIASLTGAIRELAAAPMPLVITGSHRFFSAGADLNEIVHLGRLAFSFALAGQELMDVVDKFPAPVCAAVAGYCMGGGLDLALACDLRIASPHALFGHRGAALGLITGWGGTQRLPRLIGKGRALQMFTAAEKIPAHEALRMGLVDALADDPVEAAMQWLADRPMTG